MVSTRLMSIVNETLTELYSQGSSSEHTVTRVTRNSVSSHPIPSTSEDSNRPSASSRSINLLDLPAEIIEKILSFLSYKNVCQLRLVSIVYYVLLQRYGDNSFGIKF